MITPTVKQPLLQAICFSLFLLIPAFASARTTHPPAIEEGKSVFDQMYQEDLLEITLETDLVQLLGDKKSDTYYTAFLHVNKSDGSALTHPVNVRMRGKYRRRVCDFPPLKFKFPEEYLETEGFNPRYRSLKLVTHCLDDKREGKDNVLREYLAYRLFNELSDKSFRVQLVHITYMDRTDKSLTEERYGFIIEDPDQVADRIGGSECEEGCMNPDPSSLDEKETALVALYQYMIGNSDWNIRMMRNIKLITFSDERKQVLLPYDFDFAGLINAGYAIPNNDYDLTHIRERIYLGPETSDPVMKWALNYMKFKRKSLIKTVRDLKLLSSRSRTDALEYLDSFFIYVDKLNVNTASNLHQTLSGATLGYPLPG